MATLDNRVFDNGLTVLDTEANAIHVTSAEATSFANVAAVTLGNSTSLSIGAPADRAGGGREVVVAAITDGSSHRHWHCNPLRHCGHCEQPSTGNKHPDSIAVCHIWQHVHAVVRCYRHP